MTKGKNGQKNGQEGSHEPKILSKEEIEDIELLEKLSVSQEWYNKKTKDLPVYKDKEISMRALNRVIGDKICERINIICLETSKEKYFYYEPEQLWRTGVDVIVKLLTRKMFSKATAFNFNSVELHAEISGYHRDSILNRRNVLPLINGVFNFDTCELESHDINNFITYKMPVKYDPTLTEAPHLTKFIKGLVHPDNIVNLMEMWSYCLHPSYDIAKAIILKGAGENGKSTFLNVLLHFLGKSNCSSLTLQQMQSDFAIKSLRGKMANIAPDIPQTSLKDASRFKMLTGGDLINADVKFKERISFYNVAKLFFSCNKVPPLLYKSTYAFKRRWLIVNFPFYFVPNPTKSNERQQVNQKEVFKLVTKPEEFSAFLNILLVILKELLKRNAFLNPTPTEVVEEAFAEGANIATTFIQNELVEKKGVETSKREIYKMYASECERAGERPLGEHIFNRQIRVDYPHIHEKRIRQKDKSLPRCWIGLAIRSLSDSESKEESSAEETLNNPRKEVPTGGQTIYDHFGLKR